MTDFTTYKPTLNSIEYYVYALCEIDGDQRKPFYIGKGKGTRCLQHLNEPPGKEKTNTIQRLQAEERLGIDILRYGIEDNATAELIEATCIDLLGIGELSNMTRGSGSSMGRMPLDEIHALTTRDLTEVAGEHQGMAFILNKSYKSGMSELALFEATCGVWHNVPRDRFLKYAYATYRGIVKEVYEIHQWARAGTREYSTRTFENTDLSTRWEFVGKKASNDVRQRYLGKLLDMPRSYGTPFIRVGG